MTNPIINPQPNYSGVTIQISNPAVNVGKEPYQNHQILRNNGSEYCSCPQIYGAQNYYSGYEQGNAGNRSIPLQPPTEAQMLPIQQAYPPQYYLNNYNYQNNDNKEALEKILEDVQKNNKAISQNEQQTNSGLIEEVKLSDGNKEQALENAQLQTSTKAMQNTPKIYQPKSEEPQDLSKSQAVIDDLDARAVAMEEEKKNTKQKRVVALTDEYIKSLENYLNNPNDEIRLMASKEILTRLDEDKERYDDAALNALLNKMLQDPSKLVRIAALSAFASQLASGNDYTVELLHNIQANPSADKEDVIQAADILLKMSAGTEIKNIPNPSVKEENNAETTTQNVSPLSEQQVVQ